MSSRRQSIAEVYGKPVMEVTSHDVATCSTCRTPLEFTTDALGRLRERCPKCQGVAASHRIRPIAPPVPQARLTNAAELLPPVAPGQLRCQRCAKGLNNSVRRFCPDCLALRPMHRAIGGHEWSEEQRKRIGESTKRRRAAGEQFKPRVCACGNAFAPTSPSQRWCAKDCPARLANVPPSGPRPRFRSRVCKCGLEFSPTGPNHKYCAPECPARTAA